MTDYFLFIPGLIFLTKGAEYLVKGSSSIARQFKIPDLVIGLTVVSMGTSLPELVVNLFASFSGNTEIAIGNIIGSNIFNILWILGLSAVIKPLPFQVVSNLDILVMTGSTLLVVLLVAIGRKNNINRISGGVFISGYIGYLVFLVYRG